MANLNYEDADRATGRTIRQMMQAIISLSMNPNSWIKVEDHHRLPSANRYQLRWIADTCRQLGMATESKVDSSGCYIQFVK